MSQRMEFSQLIIEDINMLDDILWTDEAYFSTDGFVNRHNAVIWGFELPIHTHHKGLYSSKVYVLMAISKKYRLKPLFFESTVNGSNYLSLLKGYMLPQLKIKRKMTSNTFQQNEHLILLLLFTIC